MQVEVASGHQGPRLLPPVFRAEHRNNTASVERRLWRDNARARLLLYLSSGLALLASGCWFCLVWVLANIIADVFLEGASAGDLRTEFVVLFALVGARAGFALASDHVAQGAAERVKGRMRARFSAKLIALGPLYTRGERTGGLVHAAVQDFDALDEYVAEYLVARYLAGLVPALVFILVLLLDPWTLPILLFTGPLLLVFLAFIGSRTRDLTQRREAELTWMSSHFLDMLQGLPTLKMFGRSKEQAKTIETISRRHASLTMEVLRTAFQTTFVLELGATAATALVAITVSVRLMDTLIPFNVALTVLLLTPEFFLPLRRLSMSYHAGSTGLAAAESIYALIDQPEPAQVARRSKKGAPDRIRLRFDDVRFAYDHGQRAALDGFTLEVPEGKITALCGPSGAGKSTVASLLLRFAQPDSGVISVDGVPLEAIDLDAWRSRVAWVSQHPYFFHGTVAENLRLARPKASQDDLIAATTAANAHEFIAALPEAYDTQIGERGIRLSGGQLQRLAIARAFLKHALLLILDEPTSHLDAESEARISETLRNLPRAPTVLIISHESSLAEEAAVVVELEDGRVKHVACPTDRLTAHRMVAGSAAERVSG